MSTVRATTYTVLPDDWDTYEREGWDERYTWTIDVVDTGVGTWAVRWGGRALSREGKWDWEPRSSDRDDEWLKAHRFSEGDAIQWARGEVNEIQVNGRTVAEAYAWVTERRKEEGGE